MKGNQEMSGNVNLVILVGRVGKKPEARVAGAATVTTFPLATNEQWNDDAGRKQERVEWHQITAWNVLAANCVNQLDKGSLIYIEGSLKTSSWEDQGTKET